MEAPRRDVAQMIRSSEKVLGQLGGLYLSRRIVGYEVGSSRQSGGAADAFTALLYVAACTER
jgi:hypothetical protein